MDRRDWRALTDTEAEEEDFKQQRRRISSSREDVLNSLGEEGLCSVECKGKEGEVPF